MKPFYSLLFLAGYLSATASAAILAGGSLDSYDGNSHDKRLIFGGAGYHNDNKNDKREPTNAFCLSQKQAEDITNKWLGIFSGHPELLNKTLAPNVVVYDSLVNNGNLGPLATSRDEYYGFVMNFTYPKDGAITNTSYTLNGGGFMFHSCDKIAMRYIGHATCTGKYSVPAGTPITVAVNQLLSVNEHGQIDIAWSEYDLFSMLKQIGVLKDTWDGI